ncbi:MAG: S8 family serine peptidase, partial [Flavobacteriales bacterium]|nr:S8 family serine peptidase [Flavobacteriales bacterium]
MDQQLYAERASLNERTQRVITSLKNKASSTQGPLLEFLRNASGVGAGSVHRFWITNVIFCSVDAEVIEELSKRLDVESIDLNVELLLDEYESSSEVGPAKSIGGREPGHDAVKAPAMWAMGYSGYGRKVMSLDTGVDPYHPAISNQFDGKYHDINQSWFVLGRPGELPADCNGHGTHTVGTMCGLDTMNADTIGVAWGARWIGSPNLCGGGSST